MRIQFVRDNYAETINFDVAEVPTEEDVKAIYDDIYATMDKYEEENGNLNDFDFWQCCHDAAIHHVHLVNNPVVKTFYVF